MAHWTIRADYDPEASVWYSVDGDIPGLAADATTLEALAAKAGAMLPDLLDIHADDIADPARLAGPPACTRCGGRGQSAAAGQGTERMTLARGAGP